MSDPDKARYLNELVNLDIIARTQSNIGTRLTTETTSKKTALATLEEKTDALAGYDWIDQAEHDAKVEAIRVGDENRAQLRKDNAAGISAASEARQARAWRDANGSKVVAVFGENWNLPLGATE